MLELQKSERKLFEALIEDLQAVYSEGANSMAAVFVEAKHRVGELICTNALYSKNKRGSGEFITAISKTLKKSERDLRLCVDFYLHYPELNYEAISKLADPRKKTVRWSDIVQKLLTTPSECPSGHRNTLEEVVTITKTKCADCGAILNEIKAVQ